MKKIKTPWPRWRIVTKAICLNSMIEWTNAEMKSYWEKGYSPLAALEASCAKRKQISIIAKELT